jgi:hypothetical protein
MFALVQILAMEVLVKDGIEPDRMDMQLRATRALNYECSISTWTLDYNV